LTDASASGRSFHTALARIQDQKRPEPVALSCQKRKQIKMFRPNPVALARLSPSIVW